VFVITTEREEIEQKEKRPSPSMYFANRGSVLTRRIPGIEQVAMLTLYVCLSCQLLSPPRRKCFHTCWLVCLSVCLSVCLFARLLKKMLMMKFLRAVGLGKRKNLLDFVHDVHSDLAVLLTKT